MPRAIRPFLALAVASAFAFQTPQSAGLAARVADPFAPGWMLEDTNGDGIVDYVAGRIVVPAQPTAAENAAAANLAARLGFGTTGFTPPVVVAANEDSGGGPRIYVGKGAVPAGQTPPVALETDEGGVFAIGPNLAVIGASDAGLMAAADAYSARAPYQWRVPGKKLSDIGAALTGVTYLRGKSGVHRAFFGATEAPASAIEPGPAQPAGNGAAAPAGGAPGGATGANGATGDAAGGATRLDLATLYTSRGLFGAAGRIPLPASSNARLFVPAGSAGIAMANLAARMGLETTGITLPIAAPADGATVRDVRASAVIAGDSALAQGAEKKLRADDTAFTESETALAPGEGELRIADNAFGRRAAILARGDERGQAAALSALSDRFPNLWEQGKQYLSIEEIRYDLHKFFSVRSSSGQAAAALYHLDRWMAEAGPGAKDVKAEIYTDVADAKLADFVRQQAQDRLHAAADVKVASLRAGTACCAQNPALHYDAPGYSFHATTPTFTEDIAIPWEGKRLMEAVRRGSAKIAAGDEVKLVARVSEGPEERRKLQADLRDLLVKAGADAHKLNVEVLCAYKQGYSWLMDEIAPALAGKGAASIKIDFAKDIDATGMRAMHTEARWVQELYPVDEMLARKLSLPLDKIALNEIEPPATGATYRVHAFDAAGKEILTREFKVTTVMQPYNGVVPRYEDVQVETGWVHLEDAGKVALNERIKTDIEEFWEHYQTKTLPHVYQFVLSQAKGEIRAEYLPPFDSLTLDFHMSEPDYSLDLDKERISTLEALQEDTFYSTANFVSMIGDLETGRPIGYTGRIIPIAHPSEDGKDGHVHIEFYGKAAANPLVRFSWTDGAGAHHAKERNLPPMTGEFQPRLIQARVKAGEDGIERLTWLLPADFAQDKYDDWLKVEGQDQVDRGIFSAERARGMLHWLDEMHRAGIYRDEVAYPHLQQMAIEFECHWSWGTSSTPRHSASSRVGTSRRRPRRVP